jgi:TolA-binding protein
MRRWTLRQWICLLGILVLSGLTPHYGLKPLSFEARLKKADQALNANEYERAIRQYLVLIDQFPKHEKSPLLLLQIANAYRLSGRTEASLQAYNLVGVRYPSTSHALQALTQKAELLFQNEHFPQALLAYQSLLLNFPESESANLWELRLGVCHLKAKQLEAARREFDLLLSSTDETLKPQALFYKGNTYLLENRFDPAIEIYKTFLSQYPENELGNEVKFNLANAYENLDHYDLALEIYEELQKTYPNPRVIQLQIQRNQEKKLEAQKREKPGSKKNR